MECECGCEAKKHGRSILNELNLDEDLNRTILANVPETWDAHVRTFQKRTLALQMNTVDVPKFVAAIQAQRGVELSCRRSPQDDMSVRWSVPRSDRITWQSFDVSNKFEIVYRCCGIGIDEYGKVMARKKRCKFQIICIECSFKEDNVPPHSTRGAWSRDQTELRFTYHTHTDDNFSHEGFLTVEHEKLIQGMIASFIMAPSIVRFLRTNCRELLERYTHKALCDAVNYRRRKWLGLVNTSDQEATFKRATAPEELGGDGRYGHTILIEGRNEHCETNECPGVSWTSIDKEPAMCTCKNAAPEVRVGRKRARTSNQASLGVWSTSKVSKTLFRLVRATPRQLQQLVDLTTQGRPVLMDATFNVTSSGQRLTAVLVPDEMNRAEVVAWFVTNDLTQATLQVCLKAVFEAARAQAKSESWTVRTFVVDCAISQRSAITEACKAVFTSNDTAPHIHLCTIHVRRAWSQQLLKACPSLRNSKLEGIVGGDAYAPEYHQVMRALWSVLRMDIPEIPSLSVDEMTRVRYATVLHEFNMAVKAADNVSKKFAKYLMRDYLGILRQLNPALAPDDSPLRGIYTTNMAEAVFSGFKTQYMHTVKSSGRTVVWLLKVLDDYEMNRADRASRILRGRVENKHALDMLKKSYALSLRGMTIEGNLVLTVPHYSGNDSKDYCEEWETRFECMQADLQTQTDICRQAQIKDLLSEFDTNVRQAREAVMSAEKAVNRINNAVFSKTRPFLEGKEKLAHELDNLIVATIRSRDKHRKITACLKAASKAYERAVTKTQKDLDLKGATIRVADARAALQEAERQQEEAVTSQEHELNPRIDDDLKKNEAAVEKAYIKFLEHAAGTPFRYSVAPRCTCQWRTQHPDMICSHEIALISSIKRAQATSDTVPTQIDSAVQRILETSMGTLYGTSKGGYAKCIEALKSLTV